MFKEKHYNQISQGILLMKSKVKHDTECSKIHFILYLHHLILKIHAYVLSGLSITVSNLSPNLINVWRNTRVSTASFFPSSWIIKGLASKCIVQYLTINKVRSTFCNVGTIFYLPSVKYSWCLLILWGIFISPQFSNPRTTPPRVMTCLADVFKRSFKLLYINIIQHEYVIPYKFSCNLLQQYCV